MPQPNNDEVAKALERLAAGQSDEPIAPSDDVSHAAAPAPTPPAPVPAARPAAPVRAPGTGATPQPKRVVSRSSAPVPAVNRPLQPPGSAAPPAPRPPGIGKPAARPVSAEPAPNARRPAPAGPLRPSAPAVPTPAPVCDTEVVDDDDRVIVPAPSVDVFMHHGSASARRSAKRGSSLRQTFIPILLTSGFILMALGVLRFVWPGDNPLASIPPWLVAILFGFALALWGLAAMNMLAVKHDLEPRKPA